MPKPNTQKLPLYKKDPETSSNQKQTKLSQKANNQKQTPNVSKTTISHNNPPKKVKTIEHSNKVMKKENNYPYTQILYLFIRLIHLRMKKKCQLPQTRVSLTLLFNWIYHV